MLYKNHIKTILLLFLALFLSITQISCVKKIAMNKVVDALTAEGGTVFSGDNDPLLIMDALPFTLKTYESLLAQMPENQKLLLAAGRTFCMYSFAFIHAGADTMSDLNINEKNARLQRAKKMYLRSYRYILSSLDVSIPGFSNLIEQNKIDSALAKTNKEHLDLLYWCGMSWMGAFTCDKFDMEQAVGVPNAVAMLTRVLELDESFNNGAIHDFFITYCGAMPASMGGSEIKAREHFKRSIELSGNRKAGPYVSLATTVCVAKQDPKEFKSLLETALLIDPELDPENTLVNTITLDKARWLLRSIDDFFLSDDSDEFIEEPKRSNE